MNLADLERTLGRRFARVATNSVLRNPFWWRVFRAPLRRQFNRLAPRWASLQEPDGLASFEAALEHLPPPRRALDLGTGTGAGAVVLARRFSEAEVTGVDLAESMLEQARRGLPPDLSDRVRFERADASALPYADETFDLVAHANMIPFFDELARVLAPGGFALFAFSRGPETPIYVTPERLRAELGRRGFADFAAFAAGSGSALLARKRARA